MSHAHIERHGTVSVITLDNPPVNALSLALRRDLVACLDAAVADKGCQAIVIACAGRTFIAGADIREFGKPPAPPYLPDVVEKIECAVKPVVAAIHGTALGGGLEVAMGCHYRVASADASVGLPEVKLGLLPGATGTQRLTRLAGPEAAMNIMLSGDPVSAADALTLGIVDAVIDEDDLLGAAVRFAGDVCAKKPVRVRDLAVPEADPALFEQARRRIAGKTRGLVSPEKIIQCVEAAVSLDYQAGCRIERELFLECKSSPQSNGLRHAFFAQRAVSKVPGIGRDTRRRELNAVAVLGAGTMGAGIAYSCLTAGLSVHLLDNDEAGLIRGRQTVSDLYDFGVQRGKLSSAAAEAGMTRLTTTTQYADIAEADLIIEAVFENMAVKKDVFARLDEVCKPGAILATNTSTLDIDAIATATSRPADVIGLHFFSPAHIMRLLEVVRGRETADDVIATAMTLAKRLRKIGVVVGNCFGFVGNRMLYSYGRENQLLLLEGAAPEYIDEVLFDWGMAMGPNAVGDLAGLDVGYKVRQERSDRPDDPRFYRIADMLAEQGRYGQKTGRGMYLYENGSRTPVPDPVVRDMIRAEAERLGVEQRQIPAHEIIQRCIYGLVTEGARILQDGIALRASDIDVIWMSGYGFPRHRGGPMHYADRIGLDTVGKTLYEFHDRFGSAYWDIPPLIDSLIKEGRSFGDLDLTGS